MEKRDYADALMVQDACNLCGVVQSFAELLKRLMTEATENGEGTDYVNRHPLSVMYADKIRDLTRLTDDALYRAYKVCNLQK